VAFSTAENRGSVRAIAGKIIVVPSIYKSLPSRAGERCVAPAFYESGSRVRVEHSAGAYTSNAALRVEAVVKIVDGEPEMIFGSAYGLFVTDEK
jgi:hypothetical protein